MRKRKYGLTGSTNGDNSRLRIPALDLECPLAFSGLSEPNDALAILHAYTPLLSPPRDPAQIIGIFLSRRDSRSPVNEVEEAVLGMEVREEGYGRAGVSQGCEVFHEAKSREYKIKSERKLKREREDVNTDLICIRAPGSNIPGCHLNFSCCSRKSTSRIGVS